MYLVQYLVLSTVLVPVWPKLELTASKHARVDSPNSRHGHDTLVERPPDLLRVEARGHVQGEVQLEPPVAEQVIGRPDDAKVPKVLRMRRK